MAYDLDTLALLQEVEQALHEEALGADNDNHPVTMNKLLSLADRVKALRLTEVSAQAAERPVRVVVVMDGTDLRTVYADAPGVEVLHVQHQNFARQFTTLVALDNKTKYARTKRHADDVIVDQMMVKRLFNANKAKWGPAPGER